MELDLGPEIEQFGERALGLPKEPRPQDPKASEPRART
jgi:hypothetical protein